MSSHSRNCFKAALVLRKILKEPQFLSSCFTFRELNSPKTNPIPLFRELHSSRHFGSYHYCFATHSENFHVKEKGMYKEQLFLGQQGELSLSEPFG